MRTPYWSDRGVLAANLTTSSHGHRSAHSRVRIIARPRGTVRRAQRRRAAVSSRISARDRLHFRVGFRRIFFVVMRPRTSTDLSVPAVSLLSQGTKAKGGQAGVGYRGSTEAGSAPKT